MASDPIPALVSFIGVVVELCGAGMLVALFGLLRRYVTRRAYLRAWTAAWAVLGAALCAVVIRYSLMPGLIQTAAGEAGPVNRLLYVVYQTGKVAGDLLSLAGSLAYARRRMQPRTLARLVWGAAAYAVLSNALSPTGLNQMVVWQSPVAAAVLGSCAGLLFSLPPSRRTLGSATTATAFALLALLWALYGFAFAGVVRAAASVTPAVHVIVAYNTYLDLLLNLLLGYGMVLLVMEDARREVDDARAELRMAHERMQRVALYDTLTECLNRRAYAEGLGLEMARATYGVVAIADVDDLKATNDAYGHATGDQVLRHCAKVLRAGLRSYDKLYRWGGDEFLLIMPSARAADVLKRLQGCVDEAEVPHVVPAAQRLRVSIGAADYLSAEELEEAISRADYLMYREKERRKRNASPAAAAAPVASRLPEPAKT